MQYRPHRYNTQFPIELLTPTGRQRGRVIDVNTTGARLEGPQALQRGDKVRLGFLNHRIDAIVRWVAGGRVGLVFQPEINEHLVDTLRYRRDGRGQGAHKSFGFSEMR